MVSQADVYGNPNYKNLSKIETYTGERFTEEEQEIRAFKTQDSLSEDKYSESCPDTLLLVLE